MSQAPQFFLYARKSTDEKDRQVYSIPHQMAELRQLATRKDLHILAEFEEKQTAMSPGRPVFNSILDRIRKGEADGVLAWHPDRLSRNSYDSYQILDMIEQKTVTLEFASYTFVPTPEGILTLGIAFDMAKYSSASLSANIHRGQRRRLLDGHWPYVKPVGYLFDRNSRRVIPDPQRAPLIREAFELYATGEYSLDQLQQIMTARGLTRRLFKGKPPGPMSRTHYHRILHNPFYVGLMLNQGQTFQGQHEPLVNTHLFDTCQIILGQNGNYRSSKLKPFLYRGMFRCGECGGMVTMETHKGHIYMRCTKTRGKCSQQYLRQEWVARRIARTLERLRLSDSLIGVLLAEAEEKQTYEVANIDRQLNTLKAEVETCELKLQRLTNTYVEGTMPLESFSKTKEKLLKQKLHFIEKLTFTQTHRRTPLEPVISFIRGLTEAQHAIEGDDELQKRDLLQRAGSNLTIKDGNVFWQPSGPWKHVAELGRLGKRLSRGSSLSTFDDDKRLSQCRIAGAVRPLLESLCMTLKSSDIISASALGRNRTRPQGHALRA